MLCLKDTEVGFIVLVERNFVKGNQTTLMWKMRGRQPAAAKSGYCIWCICTVFV